MYLIRGTGTITSNLDTWRLRVQTNMLCKHGYVLNVYTNIKRLQISIYNPICHIRWQAPPKDSQLGLFDDTASID